LPSALVAAKASDVPSGESTGGQRIAVRLSVVFSGGLMTVRTELALGGMVDEHSGGRTQENGCGYSRCPTKTLAKMRGAAMLDPPALTGPPQSTATLVVSCAV